MLPHKNNAAALHKRLRYLYVTAFFQGLVLWYAVEKLFMKTIGINDAGIAVIIVVFTLVMMLVNVPLGVLADRWSRKGVLALATLALVAATIIDGSSHDFWLYLLGSCLWGIHFACYSGTYDSIVYDTLVEETGNADNFEYYYGKVQLFDGIALVIASLLSAVVLHFYTLRAVYFVTAPLASLSLLALWQFREPQLHKSNEKTLLGAHLRATMQAVLRRREVLWLTLSLIALTVAERLVLEFDQLWLIALALPLFLYGPVNALLLSAYGASGLVANLIKGSRPVIIGLGLAMVAASTCLLFHVVSLTIAALFVVILGMTALTVVINRWLHDELPSAVRAGASSTVTTIGYALFLPIGLLFGEVSRHADIFEATWVVIATCVAVAASVLVASRRPASPVRE